VVYGGWTVSLGVDEMTVGTEEPAAHDRADLKAQLRTLTDFVVRSQASNEIRFDRIESDMAGVKADVVGLKSDVAGLKTDVAVLKSDVAGLKTDVAVLKTDVAVLKSDTAETKGQLNRMELAMQHGFNNLTAQIEALRKAIPPEKGQVATPA
jgi:septal ring factor EnvC (AmiA/AmiB activator)